ncbi:UNVERIFIED_ORG: hypothetical protein J2W38_006266 [Variovorax paradoxus]|nr:hypothetical protein [Variovorax paradoxus]
MEWFEPWWSPENLGEQFQENFKKQLEREMPTGHCMHGLPVRLLARGNGDDALFEILDGSGRVADVHLTWSRSQQRLPWPGATIYQSLDEWAEKVMLPQHRDWIGV